MRKADIKIEVGERRLAGRFLEPGTGWPGVLFVHGWAGSQKRDEKRSRYIARLGCICLTFDMRGHGLTQEDQTRVTRADNLADIRAAYDKLASHPAIDASSIAVVGSSYGAYLSAYLTAERDVRWLAMRVPALYRDDDWDVPKHALDRHDLQLYRSRQVPLKTNRALRQCQKFRGDVLIVESENDELVPHPTIASYLASFGNARSITHRIIDGADHALSEPESRRSYDDLLTRWLREMILNAR
ncbi:S9 family peptidase [Nitratireductor sp. ZSWI3]|uniref:alpha/beta hydrolase family protein n=1 Tax=Nitratireductor sp. ZSWI3 TaxID=2966359 RepID=UPI00214F6FC3|nr:alpha/beta fold hydrolase [Nitratireductor sp. ZSWI3]MCR4264690.1 alpha/beta fold hydrolase [Nitratireductor sp. ZSWI3]